MVPKVNELSLCLLSERLTEGMARMEEPLVKMKFVCKEFWTALLGHHAGGLKTNHKVDGFIHVRIHET